LDQSPDLRQPVGLQLRLLGVEHQAGSFLPLLVDERAPTRLQTLTPENGLAGLAIGQR